MVMKPLSELNSTSVVEHILTLISCFLLCPLNGAMDVIDLLLLQSSFEHAVPLQNDAHQNIPNFSKFGNLNDYFYLNDYLLPAR